MSNEIPTPPAEPLATPTLKRLAVACAIAAFAWLYVFPYYPHLNNPNENVRLYMTAAMVEEGTYKIDAMRERWGWVNDAGVRDGHYYSVKAPGTSLLGLPGYWVYTWFADDPPDKEKGLWASRLTGTILPSLVFLAFFYLWLGRRTPFPFLRDSAFLAVALGSVIYGYGLLFASHTTSAACGFGAFMLIYDARHEGRITAWRAFAAGLLVAGVTFFEYPGIIASVVLTGYAFYVIRPWKRLIHFCAGGLIPTLLVMHFQWSAFGSPFSPGHLYVENKAFRAGHEEGLYGATHFRTDAAGILLFDERLGLFTMTPFLLFGLLGFFILLLKRRYRVDAAVVFLSCGVLFYAICSMNIWHAGWSIGPRYLVLLIPFFAWMAVVGLGVVARRSSTVAATLAVGTVAFGFVMAGVPSAYFPHLPEQVDRPIAQLFSTLIAHGYAPTNAGSWFDIYGSASMLPLALVALLALVWSTGEGLARRQRLIALGVGLATAAVVLVPFFQKGPEDDKARPHVANWTRRWHPPGHDEASLLEAKIKAGQAKYDDYLELAELYFAEGRDDDAEHALKRGVDRARDAGLLYDAYLR